MSWSIGYDENWKRDIGYGVPSICDHPGCGGEINRGLSYVCGGEPYGGEFGCGLFFCGAHLLSGDLCAQCSNGREPFQPTADTEQWIQWKLTHHSWQQWRNQNPDEVRSLISQEDKR